MQALPTKVLGVLCGEIAPVFPVMLVRACEAPVGVVCGNDAPVFPIMLALACEAPVGGVREAPARNPMRVSLERASPNSSPASMGGMGGVSMPYHSMEARRFCSVALL